MAWGVVEDPYMKFAPGTVNLTNSGEDGSSASQRGLKKRGEIVLQPQPSDSPNDPLNWSQAWKIAHFSVIVFGSGITNALSTMVTPGLLPLSEQFNVSPDTASSLIIGAYTFWTSVATFPIVAAASIWGRRPFYVISIAILFAANAGAFLAKSFPVLVAMRIIAGFAAGPLFSIVTATISDIFFVHERGIYIAVWTVMLSCGGQMGQVVAGFVVDSLGVSAVFGLAALLYALLFPISYFVVLESSGFQRSNEDMNKSASADPGKHGSWMDVEDADDIVKAEPKKSYRQQLRLFPGRLNSGSFWIGTAEPLGLITFPSVFYTTIVFSVYFLVLVGVPIVASVVFSAPPYALTPSQVGLTNLPLVAVSVVGGPLFGWVADAIARFMARRNKAMPGVFEPEYRLVLLIVCAPVTAVGLVGFAISTDKQNSLAWEIVWMSLVTLGSAWTAQLALTYVVDCFPELSSQAFASINLVASVLLFVGSGSLITWFEQLGPLIVFGSLASLAVIVAVLGLLPYVYGKRLRSFVARTQWALAQRKNWKPDGKAAGGAF